MIPDASASAPAKAASAPARGARLPSVDVLRGAVIVLMALDHARDFYSNVAFSPTDLTRTTPLLFATRWITHFCAPVFILLAGASAWLYRGEGQRSDGELARFLLSRGLFLVGVEVAWNNFMWRLDPGYATVMLQVLWAIGVSMMALAALVFLPRAGVALVAVALVAGHNLLDGHVGTRADASLVWRVLEVGGARPLGGHRVILAYPVLAWIGVMAAGYALLGPALLRPPAQRRRALLTVGGALTLLFLVLRLVDRYGDPRAFTPQASPVLTALSFLDCTKYPPSLDYLLMTLGPALIVLALVDGAQDRNPLAVYGRAPMFFYLLHVPLLSVSTSLIDRLRFGVFAFPDTLRERGAGYSLAGVYLAWLVVVAALYLPCRAWGELKRRHRDWRWLSYL